MGVGRKARRSGRTGHGTGKTVWGLLVFQTARMALLVALVSILAEAPPQRRFVLAGRAALPQYLKPFWVTGQLTLLGEADLAAMTAIMTALNKTACETMLPLSPSACTDITGFGLLGHAYEMAAGSGMTVVLDSRRVPIVPKALELAREGIIPSGAYNNMGYIQDQIQIANTVPLEVSDVLADPQTAGGLLIALPEHKAPELLSQLEAFTGDARMVGYVKTFSGKSLEVR